MTHPADARSPFLYSDTEHDHVLLGRTAMYAAAYVGLVATIQYLKSHLVAAERTQRRMAHEDPLTGLPNRRAFDVALDGAVAGGRPFSVLLVDVDHFKTINDTFGHTTGDEILCAIAHRTRAAVRSTDTLARIGGDELALVAPEASAEGAARLATALDDAMAGLLPAPDAAPVTLTIARASFPDDGGDRDALLRGGPPPARREGRARRVVAARVGTGRRAGRHRLAAHAQTSSCRPIASARSSCAAVSSPRRCSSSAAAIASSFCCSAASARRFGVREQREQQQRDRGHEVAGDVVGDVAGGEARRTGRHQRRTSASS